jgi:hypothetical protein
VAVESWCVRHIRSVESTFKSPCATASNNPEFRCVVQEKKEPLAVPSRATVGQRLLILTQYPLGESNPCSRTENPMSWATRRRGRCKSIGSNAERMQIFKFCRRPMDCQADAVRVARGVCNSVLLRGLLLGSFFVLMTRRTGQEFAGRRENRMRLNKSGYVNQFIGNSCATS